MTRLKTGAIVVVALLVGALAMLGISSAFAWDPGGQGRGFFGGMMGNGGPGSGGNGPGGNGYGGMMGGGNGYGGMMGGWSGQNTQPQGDPISIDKATQAAQGYVDQIGNSDLALDEVMEFQDNFYAIVKEKSTGSGAFELLVNKYTGGVFPEYGPNMMWNTKYGMMAGGSGGMMGGGGRGRGMMGGGYYSGSNAPTTAISVTPDAATAAAQKWLDENQPGSTTEKPDQFYGYYTVHFLKDGKPTGMLSVNGYTGQVWYHTWHGGFIRSTEDGQ